MFCGKKNELQKPIDVFCFFHLPVSRGVVALHQGTISVYIRGRRPLITMHCPWFWCGHQEHLQETASGVVTRDERSSRMITVTHDSYPTRPDPKPDFSWFHYIICFCRRWRKSFASKVNLSTLPSSKSYKNILFFTFCQKPIFANQQFYDGMHGAQEFWNAGISQKHFFTVCKLAILKNDFKKVKLQTTTMDWRILNPKNHTRKCMKR